MMKYSLRILGFRSQLVSRFSWLSLFLLVASSLAVSEDRHSDLLESIQKQKKRPPVTDTLTQEELLFLTTGFFRVEESIQARYNNKAKKPDLFVPEAITSALIEPKKEDPIAAVFADLSGSLNLKQISKLKEESAELAQAIREKDPADRDLRLLALIERAEWVGHILEGKIPPPESLPSPADEKAFAQFKKAFLASHEQVMKKNAALLKAIDEAKKGNKTQKEVVRSLIDFKSLDPYLKGQVEFGNQALAQDLTQAITWKDEAGNFYHDLADGTGANTTRVFVSNKPSENLSQLSNFLGSKSAQTRNGPLFVRPNAFAGKNFKTVNFTGAPLLGSQPTEQSGSNQGGPGSLAARAQTVISQNCLSCHDVSPDQFDEAKRRVQSGNMPKSPGFLTPEEKSLLIQYFSQN